MRLYCRRWFSLVNNHSPNQSETIIRKETNGAASESLTASLIDNNFYRNLIQKKLDDKECQTARAADLKKPQTTTDTYLSLPLIKYIHKLCSEIYYVIWDVIYKINR